MGATYRIVAFLIHGCHVHGCHVHHCTIKGARYGSYDVAVIFPSPTVRPCETSQSQTTVPGTFMAPLRSESWMPMGATATVIRHLMRASLF
jgi:hypothetical protein